jgi:hypothetical protein
MGEIIGLPTAAQSFITIRKVRRRWNVMLVTPHGAKSHCTTLACAPDIESAKAEGKRIATAMQRPFRMKGGGND